MSYGVNTNILNRPAQAVNPGDFDGNWSKLSAASQLIYMAPNVDTSQPTAVTFLPMNSGTPVSLAIPTQANSRADYRGTHSNRGQINALYADGHVASINYRDYSNSTTTDDDKRRWKPIFP
jgi:prepilin-type processing-associated H-X9-DG protein